MLRCTVEIRRPLRLERICAGCVHAALADGSLASGECVCEELSPCRAHAAT